MRQRRWIAWGWIYTWGGLLLASGVGWLIGHYTLRLRRNPDLPHPSEVWWLRLHGAAVLGFLIAYGAVMAVHVPENWPRRSNRLTGSMAMLVIGLLTVTGYGLYYSTSDVWRNRISALHWIVGLVTAMILTVHVVHGRHLRHREPNAVGSKNAFDGGE